MRTSTRSNRLFLSLSLCASLALVGCGDDDDDAPATDLGVRDSGSDLGTADAGGATDSGARDDAATPVDAGEADAGEADAGTSDAGPRVDGGPSTRSATLSEFSPYGNCIPGPGGSGDRLIATWTVRFENTGTAPYTASVTAASMTVTIGSAVTAHTITTTAESLPDLLAVTEMIVPVGGASFQLRMATITPGSGACGTVFCADGSATVSLTLRLGDVSVMLDSAEAMTSCAF